MGGKQLDYYWTTNTLEGEQQPFPAIVFEIVINKGEKQDIIAHYDRSYEIYESNGTTIGRFKYIVGTTRSWGEPLDYAHFEFWLQQNNTKLLLETRDFAKWFPTENFIIFEFER